MAIHFNFTITEFKLENRNKIKLWIKNVIQNQGLKLGKVYFTFCNDEELLKINQQFLNHHTYTDIITFDYCEEKIINGEIYISLERVLENSIKEKVDFKNELNRVIIHGILHLCGFKDKNTQDKKEMRKKENEMLELFKTI